MKRPSLQFYPADWRNNAKLRRCSWEARGAWLEVMCLMHDAEEYGVLRWPLKEVAQAIGAPAKLLRELADKGVLKGSDSDFEPLIYTPRSGRKDGEPVTLIEGGGGPCWFSSRMVTDEYVRQRRGSDTRFGEEKPSPSRSPKGGFGAAPSRSPIRRQSDGSTSSSSSTSTSSSLRSEDWEQHAPSGLQPHDGSEVPQLRVSKASAVCLALKAEGMAAVNPGHPELLALLDAGAEVGNFVAAAAAARGKSNPFAYTLAVVKGQMADARQMATAGPSRPATAHAESFAERDARAARDRWEQMTGRTHPDNLPRGQAGAQVIDVAASVLIEDQTP